METNRFAFVPATSRYVLTSSKHSMSGLPHCYAKTHFDELNAALGKRLLFER